MKIKIKIEYHYKLLILIFGVAFIATGFLGDDKNGIHPPKPLYKLSNAQSGKVGDAYGMNVNNIWLPLNRKGIIADVDVPPNGSEGQFAGANFLFSAGFFLSGYRNGQLWANACASATLVEDYVQGIVGGQNDPNAVLYVVNAQDEPFGQSWQDWIDAVNLGADFVDGDGDGVYNPVDKPHAGEPPNGIYDDDEDMPDLLGDETVWCVYNDGLPVAQRRWNTSLQVGVEVRQTVFAFASAGAIGNIVFVRFRFTYVGLNESDPDSLTNVYFGVWADPDVGDYTDDLVGVDVPRNAGYTYNKQVDAVYGPQVPCFMIDFFSGPRVQGSPTDTATSVRGQFKGIKHFPGYKNLPISSFVEYINGDANLNDPSTKEEARFYMEGKTRQGDIPDPCTWPYGNAGNFPGCDTTDARFWFSGDPVANNGMGSGWLCANEVDQRQMTNTGPFVLYKDNEANRQAGKLIENEIVVAYVVGRGSAPLDGITKARAIDDGAQNIFDLNFLAPTPPPAPVVTLSSSDDFIDISWETVKQDTFSSVTPTWNMQFEGYQVWAFKTDIAEDIVAGEENSVLLAIYDKADFIDDIYIENSETGGIEGPIYKRSSDSNQLDSMIYADPATGRIRLRVSEDPFIAGQKIVKGRPYYFAVTSYAINWLSLVYKPGPGQPIGTQGDYYLSSFAFAQAAENIRTVNSIVVGESELNPPVPVQPSNKISGFSLGNVGYDVINNTALTGDTYEVTFSKDSSSVPYSMYWKLTNLSTGSVLVPESKSYTYGNQAVNQVVTEGFITKVEMSNATIGFPTYDPPDDVWYLLTDPKIDYTSSRVDSLFSRGIWYPGKDLVTETPFYELKTLPYPWANNPHPDTVSSTYITTDKMRTVELRFGEEGFGKAYRYINGYKRPPIGQGAAAYRFLYAEAINGVDTVIGGINYPIDKWDAANDRPIGFVDVPFQAWVVDEQHNEEYQLAVGFIESRQNGTLFSEGNPDGVWNPGTDITKSGEFIVIFDTPYDPSGNQIELTGGEFQTSSGPVTVWTDLVRWYSDQPWFSLSIPEDAQGITEEQKAVFESPLLSTMYLLSLVKVDSASFYTPGDILTIPLVVYPYTSDDVYQFTTLEGTTLSEADAQTRWEKVNVYPNPLLGYNTLTNYYTNTPDEPFVTFTNLPEEITIKIYSLSGTLLRTLGTEDKDSPASPYIRWDLQNESGLRVASGMYMAIVSSPKYGDKVLKFAIIMPQKQIQRF